MSRFRGTPEQLLERLRGKVGSLVKQPQTDKFGANALLEEEFMEKEDVMNRNQKYVVFSIQVFVYKKCIPTPNYKGKNDHVLQLCETFMTSCS